MAAKDGPRVSAAGESQAQMGSAEPDFKRQNDPEQKVAKDDEPQFFDTTIAKMVQREVEDDKGNKTTEWVEVMSDNLYPGEKLKRAYDEEKAAEKSKDARKSATDAAEKRQATEDEIKKSK